MIVKDSVGSKGWTSIVPMNLNGDALTDLLSYNKTTGRTVYSGCRPAAAVTGSGHRFDGRTAFGLHVLRSGLALLADDQKGCGAPKAQ